MTRLTCRVAVLCAVTTVSLLAAGDFSTYRGFKFGATLDETATQLGMKPSEATLVHQRPAVIQELQWRPEVRLQDSPTETDPVSSSLLLFYNDALFEIVTTYDRRKVEGMTAADMVAAISLTYGKATTPGGEIPYHSNYGDVATVLARWQDSQYSCDLIQTGDRTSFALVLRSKRLGTLAQAAITEARRLDKLEAPQRALDLQKKQDANSRSELDKARTVNVPNFRP